VIITPTVASKANIAQLPYVNTLPTNSLEVSKLANCQFTHSFQVPIPILLGLMVDIAFHSAIDITPRK